MIGDEDKIGRSLEEEAAEVPPDTGRTTSTFNRKKPS